MIGELVELFPVLIVLSETSIEGGSCSLFFFGFAVESRPETGSDPDI